MVIATPVIEFEDAKVILELHELESGVVAAESHVSLLEYLIEPPYKTLAVTPIYGVQ